PIFKLSGIVMEKYLQELIQSHNRIIIPDFGAFIISRDNGQNILFNNFLTFNDGLLVSHICEVEGINSDQALEKVAQFIQKVKTALTKEGKYKIVKIGTLVRGEEGAISFESEEVKEEGDEALSVKKEELMKEEERREPILLDSSELLDLDTTDTSVKETKKEEKRPVSEPKKDIPPLSQPASSFQPPSNIVIKDRRKSKFPNWIWLVLLLLLLLIGIAVVFFFPNIPEKVQGWFNSQDEQIEVVEEKFYEPEIKPLPIDSSVFKKEKEEASPKVTRQHHVIVGTFKNEADALSLNNKLISQGLEDCSVFKHDGKYLVSINWYSSVSPALRRQEELLKTHKLENWVLSIDVQ
ncbi:MAG TPA: SPOR domain-containing protein, partial [Marinilabiliaceae bacterium]|nr:SPOR domain-containing protein [Marinilabiliaceae bacterium]